jgi:serine/threonine protein kinase
MGEEATKESYYRGTQYYDAPEVQDRPSPDYSYAVDVWGVAVTVLEIVRLIGRTCKSIYFNIFSCLEETHYVK